MRRKALGFDAIPRPTRHAVFGHLHEWVGKGNAQKVLETLLDYAERCGPVARIPLGPANLVLLSDPDPIRELLAAEQANVKGWPYVLTRVVLDNVLLLNGEPWASARGAYRAALKGADAERACDAGLARHLGSLVSGARIDAGEWVQALVADVVCELLCGASWDRALEPHRARVQYELAAVGIDMQCQPWAYLSPARWVAMRRSVAVMRAFFLAHVEARLESGEDRDDVLGGFLRAADEGAYPREPNALRDGLVNFFFTAHDVVSASASFCLWLLATHPDAQRAARDDDDALGRAVRESLRLFPGYPLFSRRTKGEVEVGGYRVPVGTDVIVSPFVLHRLERHWPDPSRFDPDRFRGALEPVRPGPRGAYMPFGGGYRSCIAFALAFPLLERIVRRVIRHAELRADARHVPDIVYWGSTSSANGLPIRVA